MSCGCTPCNDCPPDPIPVPLPDCAGGEPCEEVINVACSSYNGPNLPALGIDHGDRLITMFTKLHKTINAMLGEGILPVVSYTATSTTTIPMVVTYLGKGPVYTSVPGATNSGTLITVGSTTGLEVGMVVNVTSGTGAFDTETTVTSIPSATTFIVSVAPTTNLTSNAVITAYGSEDQIFNISVVQGIPKSFQAYVGSPVKLSGTGTIV